MFHVSKGLADALEEPSADILRGRRPIDIDSLEAAVGHEVTDHLIGAVAEKCVVDLGDHWIDELFEVEVIEHHPVRLRLARNLDPETIRMAVDITTAAIMLRQAVRHLPAEVFRNTREHY